MTDTTKQIEPFRDEQWFRATKGIIDRCVAPVMYSDAMRMLYSVQELAARATPVSPAQTDSDFVTRSSALDAIDYVDQSNSAGRAADARESLVAAAPAKPQSDLHSAIMNLPCKTLEPEFPLDNLRELGIWQNGAKFGHRDARHAAAELVTAAQSEHEREIGLLRIINDQLKTRLAAADERIAELEAASVGAQVAGEPVAEVIAAEFGRRVVFLANGKDLPKAGTKLYTAPVPAPATQAERQPQPAAQAAVPDINAMVNRFLGWKLPETFSPDCGISFKPLGHPNGWPVGTNLLTAGEAKAMFEFCAAAPAAVPQGVEAQKIHGNYVVYVCPERDIECGNRQSSWCSTCPKRVEAQKGGADHE